MQKCLHSLNTLRCCRWLPECFNAVANVFWWVFWVFTKAFLVNAPSKNKNKSKTQTHLSLYAFCSLDLAFSASSCGSLLLLFARWKSNRLKRNSTTLKMWHDLWHHTVLFYIENIPYFTFKAIHINIFSESNVVNGSLEHANKKCLLS